jgi:hypothetical protein
VHFWSDAETEIALAAEAGVTVYRLGVDWGRLVPEEPLQGTESVVCWQQSPPLYALDLRVIEGNCLVSGKFVRLLIRSP